MMTFNQFFEWTEQLFTHFHTGNKLRFAKSISCFDLYAFISKYSKIVGSSKYAIDNRSSSNWASMKNENNFLETTTLINSSCATAISIAHNYPVNMLHVPTNFISSLWCDQIMLHGLQFFQNYIFFVVPYLHSTPQFRWTMSFASFFRLCKPDSHM